MSDVLQTAQKYQQKLSVELAKIEEFIRFANELSKRNGSESPLSPTNPTASEVRVEDPPRPSVDRAEEPPIPSVDQAEAKKPQADSEPEKSERKSLFRSALKLGDADRIADRVKGVA